MQRNRPTLLRRTAVAVALLALVAPSPALAKHGKPKPQASPAKAAKVAKPPKAPKPAKPRKA